VVEHPQVLDHVGLLTDGPPRQIRVALHLVIRRLPSPRLPVREALDDVRHCIPRRPETPIAMAIGCAEPSQIRNLKPFPGQAEKRPFSRIPRPTHRGDFLHASGRLDRRIEPSQRGSDKRLSSGTFPETTRC
jgi:hypothetical protein